MTQKEYEEENKRQCLNYLEEIERLTTQITELGTRLAIKADAHAASMLVIAELEKQLSRYQGGVEVEGIWKQDGILFYPLPAVQLEFNQKVRVLVIPEERIVDANKTMEVE